jgi:hypothetical protein
MRWADFGPMPGRRPNSSMSARRGPVNTYSATSLAPGKASSRRASAAEA